MIQFRYNSHHKLIIGIAIILWAMFRFTGENEEGKSYENGQIKKIGGFNSGKNHGNWTWYYKNGKKKMEGTFLSGKRDGIWVIYDQNGIKLSQGNYKNDQLNGEFTKWNSKGDMLEKSIYKDDIVIKHLLVDNKTISTSEL